MFLLLLACLCATIFISKKFYKNMINPGTLFMGNIILSACLLFAVDFIEREISIYAYFILGISFIAFAIGAFIAKQINVVNAQYQFRIQANDKKWLIILFIISIIGSIARFYDIYTTYGIYYAIDNLNELNANYRNTNMAGIFSYLSMLATANCIILFIYLERFGVKNNKYVLIMLCLELLSLVSVRRSTFIYALSMLFLTKYFMHVREKGISFTYISSRLAIVLAIIAGFFMLLQEQLNKVAVIQGNLFGVSIPDSIANIIIYYAGNLKSFDQYINTVGMYEVEWFSASLRFVFKLMSFMGADSIDETFLQLDFVPIPYWFNTTFGQYYIIAEGGIIWAIIFYFILGAISTHLYFKYVKCGDDISLLWLVFISYILFSHVREYPIIFLESWIYILVVIIWRCFLMKKTRGINNEKSIDDSK